VQKKLPNILPAKARLNCARGFATGTLLDIDGGAR